MLCCLTAFFSLDEALLAFSHHVALQYRLLDKLQSVPCLLLQTCSSLIISKHSLIYQLVFLTFSPPRVIQVTLLEIT